MKGGACYTCGSDICDAHAVRCEDKSGETRTKAASCCKGESTGNGDCTKIDRQKRYNKQVKANC
jgi:hypothetical protein